MLAGASLRLHKVTAGPGTEGWDRSSAGGLRAPPSKARNLELQPQGQSLGLGARGSSQMQPQGDSNAEALTETWAEPEKEREGVSDTQGYRDLAPHTQ